MAESLILRTLRDTQIQLADSGAAHSYVITKEPGDMQYSVPDYTIVTALDRGDIGAIPDLRKGDEQPMSGSFSAYLRDLGDTANSYASALEIAHRYVGRFVESNWVSTMGTSSDVFTITINVTIDGSFCGEADKTVSFPYSVFRAPTVADGAPSKVSFSFISHAVRPTLS